jgi:hypothetical protein
MNQRWTLTKSVASLNMRVVVGNWSSDPTLNSTLEAAPAPAPTAKPEVTTQPVRTPAPVATAAPTALPTVPPAPPPVSVGNKQSCYIGVVEQESNIAPVYMSIPNPTAPVSSFYRMGWPVTVWGDVEGSDFVRVNRGYLNKKYLTRCAPAPEL